MSLRPRDSFFVYSNFFVHYFASKHRPTQPNMPQWLLLHTMLILLTTFIVASAQMAKMQSDCRWSSFASSLALIIVHTDPFNTSLS